MSSSALKLSRGIAGRALHLGIVPRPTNIGERQELLHQLSSKFGEIEYFRSLNYDFIPAPNSILLIFKDASSAQRCREQSPLRFRIGGEAEGKHAHLPQADVFASKIAPFLAKSRIEDTEPRTETRTTLPRPGSRAPILPFEDYEVSKGTPARLFQIVVKEPAVDMEAQVKMGWYNDRFENDARRAPNDDLRERVPVEGMANIEWRKQKKPMRLIERDKARYDEEKRQMAPLRELYERYQKGSTGNSGRQSTPKSEV